MSTHLEADWVRETVTGTPGTGTITLGSAVASYIQFEDVFTTADTVHYSVVDGNDREYGIGTLTTGSPWTLARTTPLETYDAGVYDNTTPTAISLTSAAIVTVAQIAQPPGVIVQDLHVTSASEGSVVANIPSDNTIPQTTEGLSVFSQAFTPLYADSILRIYTKTHLASSSNDIGGFTLSETGTADCLAAIPFFGTDSVTGPLTLYHEYTVTSLSTLTFVVRVGRTSSGTAFLNRVANAALWNTLLLSTLDIQEMRQ